MTLCTAHIRQVNGTEELVFATDSCLTGGEKWKHGIKLFELPRKDCLLCFAGNTIRAYPLILNLVSSIRFNSYMQSLDASLEEVLEYLSELFTNLVKTISEVDKKYLHEERGAAEFLFGGWDWNYNVNGSFRVWKLNYKEELEGFVFDELTNDSTKRNFYTFMGNANGIDVVNEAQTRYNKLRFDEGSLDDNLDMEPVRVLSNISLDKSIREVDGSLQIAKVYKSNRTEFFGIYWESSEGKPCFQGREYNEVNKPLVKYFNPDTFEIIESDLPQQVSTIDEETYSTDYDFVKDCYDDDGYLKDTVTEKQKHTLRLIFKDVAYRQFINNQESETQT